MKKIGIVLLCTLLLNCQKSTEKESADFTLAFGSCNRQNLPNVLWKEILKNQPDAWVWGGDVVYADTDDMQKLENVYAEQWQQDDYKRFTESVPVLGTWDDHDYGLNDGGLEFHKKKESQQLFLDFLEVPKNDIRRNREGVYYAQQFDTKNGNVKIIILDTRYFRTSLTKSTDPSKRYQPNEYGKGSVLGTKQWNWLQNELSNSSADFNVIVSSIQLLSYKHGYESWGNFPHEVDKLKNTVKNSKAKGVIVLSGDRHISELSSTVIAGVKNPLLDFTSSGMTHSYSSFTGEENSNRVGKVIPELSFGIIKFNLTGKKLTLQMRGIDNKLQQEFIQVYN